MDKFDPPSDPFGNEVEPKDCEYCGKEMEFHKDKTESWFSCENLMCPEKHHGQYKDMAEYIVELEYQVEYLKNSIKRITRSKS